MSEAKEIIEDQERADFYNLGELEEDQDGE